MFRNAGGLEFVQDALPEWIVPVAAVATQLGDVWFLLLLAVLASWTIERERGPWPFAAIAGGLALLLACKSAFGLARPETTVEPVLGIAPVLETTAVEAARGSVDGFPSGHAFGATVTYGLLATLLDRGTRRIRFAVAAALVVLVSATRLALAVHYPIDVVAGAALGLAYLAGASWVLDRSPVDRTTTAFAVALGAGSLAVLVSGGATVAVAYLAMITAGIAVWTVGSVRAGDRPDRAGDRPERSDRPDRAGDGSARAARSAQSDRTPETPARSGRTPPALVRAGVVAGAVALVATASLVAYPALVVASAAVGGITVLPSVRRRRSSASSGPGS